MRLQGVLLKYRDAEFTGVGIVINCNVKTGNCDEIQRASNVLN